MKILILAAPLILAGCGNIPHCWQDDSTLCKNSHPGWDMAQEVCDTPSGESVEITWAGETKTITPIWYDNRWALEDACNHDYESFSGKRLQGCTDDISVIHVHADDPVGHCPLGTVSHEIFHIFTDDDEMLDRHVAGGE